MPKNVAYWKYIYIQTNLYLKHIKKKLREINLISYDDEEEVFLQKKKQAKIKIINLFL